MNCAVIVDAVVPSIETSTAGDWAFKPKKPINANAKKIVFLGATGGRFDHTLGNLGLLLKALKLGMLSEIVDDRNKMFLINKDTVIKRDDEYKYVSFLSSI